MPIALLLAADDLAPRQTYGEFQSFGPSPQRPLFFGIEPVRAIRVAPPGAATVGSTPRPHAQCRHD